MSTQWHEVPLAELQEITFYGSDWQSMNHLENAQVAGLEMVLTLQQAAIDLKRKLEIEHCWDPECEEWKQWRNTLPSESTIIPLTF